MRKLEKNKLIIIGYFSIILVSAMGWIFADEIEGFLISLGYSFLKNWIWPIFFAINIGTISIGTQIISKIFIGEKRNNPEIQKKLFKIFGITTILGIIIFAVFIYQFFI